MQKEGSLNQTMVEDGPLLIEFIDNTIEHFQNMNRPETPPSLIDESMCDKESLKHQIEKQTVYTQHLARQFEDLKKKFFI